MNNIISFPHLGEYYIPIHYFLKKITNLEVIVPEPNNEKTIALGAKYSPSNICMSFKYNLGNYLNALNQGANVLLQTGGGCLYGYFAELQAEILELLGYNFTFVNLIKNNHISFVKLYHFAKEMNPQLNVLSYTYYLIQCLLMIIFMDKLANYRRLHQAKAYNPELFTIQVRKLKKAYSNEKLSIYKIIKRYHRYKKRCKEIPLNDNTNPLKILLIGDPYSLIDSNVSHNLENNLLNEGYIAYRYTDLTYLLLKKKFILSKISLQTKKYLKYKLGANATESIAHATYHAQKGIDGIIHIKSFGCIPEQNTISVLNKISEDYQVPILNLSFDDKANNTDINSKIVAFLDMIKARHNKF